MDVFNPLILDACIRDVAKCLSDSSKVDLLLYAMRNLELKGQSRVVIENAVQSCLQVSTLSPQSKANALVLRAKARLAAGSQLAAQTDLQAALEVDPDHIEANFLLHKHPITPEERLLPQPRCGVRFSAEIWREVALFLPRRDLKVLLSVPHTLSRVASQLLFRQLDLYFGTDPTPRDVHSGIWSDTDPGHIQNDAWHTQRSADILTRIIVDPKFASVVRSLRLFLPNSGHNGHSVGFQTGMLANALPKLVSLRNAHISSDYQGMIPILQIFERSNPRLRGLSLSCSDGQGELGITNFKNLTDFAYDARGGNTTEVIQLLQQQRHCLRTLRLNNTSWTFPFEAISIRNLTRIDFSGQFPVDSQAIGDILSQGTQLDTLNLSCVLKCTPSAQFRANKAKGSLPFLRHFSFSVENGSSCVDRDLFPAIAEFLRNRDLRTLHLTVADSDTLHRNVGFDASLWGVLPSLSNLRAVSITYPRDLAPSLALWLVPRTVRALTLFGVSTAFGREPLPFLHQLRVGIPPALRYIAFDEFPLRVEHVLEHGFHTVQLVRIGGSCWTVYRRDDGAIMNLELWPKRRMQFHAKEWLEWLGCDDVTWRDSIDFV